MHRGPEYAQSICAVLVQVDDVGLDSLLRESPEQSPGQAHRGVSMASLERLQAKGPKRILALDGGGIRRAITIEFLARIEAELGERHENPQLKLADYSSTSLAA